MPFALFTPPNTHLSNFTSLLAHSSGVRLVATPNMAILQVARFHGGSVGGQLRTDEKGLGEVSVSSANRSHRGSDRNE